MPKARINDIDLHYQVCGEGEPLLLLHGLGSSSLDWEFQIPWFAPHFKVIAPCLRGFGLSDKPDGPYTISQYASDMHQLLDHLEIERAHVLGFSMGGAIAFQLAVEHPQRLIDLIAVNSQQSFELDHWRKHLMVITRVGMASLLGMERMTRYVAKRLFPLPEQEPLRARMRERHSINRKACYLAALQALAGWSVREQMREASLPVLVLSGERDYCSMADREQFVSEIPGARHQVLAGSGHGTPFDAPDIFNAAVLDFLLGQPQAKRRAG